MASSEDQSALQDHARHFFNLVMEKGTSDQKADWLRVVLEHELAEGDVERTKILLQAGANGGAGWKGSGGRTLLDAAAEGGNEEAVGLVLEAGGSVELNAVSGTGSMTPLHRAVRGGHRAVIRKLVLRGADVSLVDSDQRTVLHHALETENVLAAEDVLLAGADVNAKMRSGDTPLHLAAARGLSPFVSILLKRGVGVDVTNDKRQSALHLALDSYHLKTAEVLLGAGANPNLRYDSGTVRDKCSPLFLMRNHVGMTKMLLKHGADVQGVDGIGYTALHRVVENSTVELIDTLVDTLVEAGADIEARSERVNYTGKHSFRGFTPIFAAVASGGGRTRVEALLRKGASLSTKDDNGLTLLHVVCKISRQNSLKVADFLLRRGADETITDNDGKTPGDLIENHEELKQLLENAPADRAWRRRGMLVLCRAHFSAKARGVVDRRRKKIKQAAEASTSKKGDSRVLQRVVGLEVDDVFKAIVKFL